MPGRSTGLWWWIDRWRRSTAYTEMSLEQQGAYRNLLDEGWLRGGPIPPDENILAKACGDPRVWAQVREKVLAHFTRAPDGLRNETLDAVLGECQRRAAKQAQWRTRRGGNNHGNDHGNAAGNTRGNNPGSPDPDPDHVRTSIEQAAVVPTEGTETQHRCVSLPAILQFACEGHPDQWALTQTHLEQWASAYPTLDILDECRHAKAWVEAAADHRKTARGMTRFLVNWFNRSVNRRHASGGSAMAPVDAGTINASYVARRRKGLI